jgi:hypothetical protein
MILPIPTITPYTSFIAFLIGLPTLVATYYQSWKARRETVEARQGLVFSGNCLEFLLDDGTTINLVPLETLHVLPSAGDIVLLPGNQPETPNSLQHGAYRVKRIEHLYTRVTTRKAQVGQARLIKAVAHVDVVSGAFQDPALVSQCKNPYNESQTAFASRSEFSQ